MTYELGREGANFSPSKHVTGISNDAEILLTIVFYNLNFLNLKKKLIMTSYISKIMLLCSTFSRKSFVFMCLKMKSSFKFCTQIAFLV